MIFELDNVELYFKNKCILNGIYLKAETGKVTGILGRNGSGESSLLEIAFGNLKPKYKLVRLNKLPLLKPLFHTKKVKYLPQYHFVPDGMKLSLVFTLFKVDWKTFTEVFDSFLAHENLKFKHLSGGERRLLATYIILKSKSELVILDEPFSHIAPLHVTIIKDIIKKEKLKKAIIISDHMYEHIIEMSDSLYLLHNGCTKRIEDLTELEDYQYLSDGTLID